eukprot:1328459-Amorphochlora_amoeboformis.AAC.1
MEFGRVTADDLGLGTRLPDALTQTIGLSYLSLTRTPSPGALYLPPSPQCFFPALNLLAPPFSILSSPPSLCFFLPPNSLSSCPSSFFYSP